MNLLSRLRYLVKVLFGLAMLVLRVAVWGVQLMLADRASLTRSLQMDTETMDKPLLVTGAAGYLASWVVRHLLEDGCAVRGLSDEGKSRHSRPMD